MLLAQFQGKGDLSEERRKYNEKILNCAYHASNAIGDEDKTRPMVEGRVPCSRAYAFPNVAKSRQRFRPFLSAALKEDIGALSGSSTPIERLT